MKSEDIKLLVMEKYSTIAKSSGKNESADCCGATGCCSSLEFTMIGDEYSKVAGYHAEADLGLGCGLPTEFAGLNPGDSVLDLGCGAGNDVFVARLLVGESGRVTGLDFSDEMLRKAQINLQRTGYTNIEFIQGDIERIPLPDSAFNVVISNCVLNLVPDKLKAFGEIFRVLQEGGHFCISDVVLTGNLPDKIKDAAEMYAGCVAGAVQKEVYLDFIKSQGFTSIEIKKEKPIVIPDSVLSVYMNVDEMKSFRESGNGIESITVTAQK